MKKAKKRKNQHKASPRYYFMLDWLTRRDHWRPRNMYHILRSNYISTKSTVTLTWQVTNLKLKVKYSTMSPFPANFWKPLGFERICVILLRSTEICRSQRKLDMLQHIFKRSGTLKRDCCVFSEKNICWTIYKWNKIQ